MVAGDLQLDDGNRRPSPDLKHTRLSRVQEASAHCGTEERERLTDLWVIA